MAEFNIIKDETLNKTIRMKSSLINEITELAGKHKVSFNAIVVQCCEFALKHLPEQNKGAENVPKNDNA